MRVVEGVGSALKHSGECDFIPFKINELQFGVKKRLDTPAFSGYNGKRARSYLEGKYKRLNESC